MGILSTIGGWISAAARAVRKVVNEVHDFLDETSVSDEYRHMVRVISVPPSRPDPSLGLGRDLMAVALHPTQQRTDEALRQVREQLQEQAVLHQRLVLRGRVMELAMQASAFDRYANNLHLHAANLGIHLQTIRNFTGLVDDVNGLRFGLKRTMGTVNHMANLINHAQLGWVDKLSGIDVEQEQGAISIRAAYSAFEQTRCLLTQEITAMVDLADQHLRDVRQVQADAGAQGDFGRHVCDMLENRIVPQLMRTRDMGLFVRNDVDRNFPRLPDAEGSSAATRAQEPDLDGRTRWRDRSRR